MNVYKIFKVHGRLIAFSLSLCRNFFRFSRPFSKKFFQRSKKQKSANRTCLSGAMSAKNKARCLLTGYLCSDMWFFRKNSPTEAILWDCISFAYFFLSLWCTLGVNWCTLWCTRDFLSPFWRLIELCACRNVRIDHQQMQLFFTVFVMHG